MPIFKVSATYCTKAGRKGSYDAQIEAPSQSEAVNAVRKELQTNGRYRYSGELDVVAWPKDA